MKFKMTGIISPKDGRRGSFRKRIPTRLLGVARKFKTTFHFEGKYGEPSYSVEVVPTHQIKISLNTSNEFLFAERSLEALRQFNDLVQKMDGLASTLEDYQISAYAKDIFDFYSSVVQDPRWKVNNASTIKSFNAKLKEAMVDISLAEEGEQEQYVNFRDILPFAGSDDWQEFFFPIQQFYDEELVPLIQLPSRDESDFSRDAVVFRTAAMTRWWLKLKRLDPSQRDIDRIMLEVDRIRSKSTYVGFVLDHSPHSRPQKSSSKKPLENSDESVTVVDVFNNWSKERDYKHNTIRAWLPVITKLNDFVEGKHVMHITRHDLVRWKEHLLQTEGKTPRNVKNNYLKTASTIFNYAHQNALIEINPLNVSIMKLQKSSKPDLLPYKDMEIGLILNATLERKSGDRFRWLAWLLAATGARVSEIAQLRTEQIIQENGVWLIDIRDSEDGATVKNKQSNRRVPIHQKIIDQGFLDFLGTKNGPVFYRPKLIKEGAKHPSASVASTHGEWLKSLADRGVSFANKSPNHSFRRWFSTHQLEIGVQEGITARIQGHKLPGERDTYVGKDIVGAMQAAVNKIDFECICDGVLGANEAL